jgi:hypothetical protein
MGKLKSRPNASADTYYTMMKTRYFAACCLAVAALMLSGCATDTTTTTTTTAETDLTKKRVHTQENLKKTGESEPGEALEKVDASVRSSGR